MAGGASLAALLTRRSRRRSDQACPDHPDRDRPSLSGLRLARLVGSFGAEPRCPASKRRPRQSQYNRSVASAVTSSLASATRTACHSPHLLHLSCIPRSKGEVSAMGHPPAAA
jgi:hypothetical protein